MRPTMRRAAPWALLLLLLAPPLRAEVVPDGPVALPLQTAGQPAEFTSFSFIPTPTSGVRLAGSERGILAVWPEQLGWLSALPRPTESNIRALYVDREGTPLTPDYALLSSRGYEYWDRGSAGPSIYRWDSRETWRVVDVASDGHDFLAVWVDARPGKGIAATRIRGEDGAVLDPGGLTVSAAPGAYPVVAHSAAGWLVVWEFYEGRWYPTHLRTALVDPSGVVIATGRIPPRAPDRDQVRPSITASGDGFVVVWAEATRTEEADRDSPPVDILAVRIPPGSAAPAEGAPPETLETLPTESLAGIEVSIDHVETALTTRGPDLVVLWTTGRRVGGVTVHDFATPASRSVSFDLGAYNLTERLRLVPLAHHTLAVWGAGHGQLLDPDTDAPVSETPLDFFPGVDVSVEADGSGLMVAPDQGLWGAAFHVRDGAVVKEPGRILLDPPYRWRGDICPVRAASDGNGFVLLGEDTPMTHLDATTISTPVSPWAGGFWPTKVDRTLVHHGPYLVDASDGQVWLVSPVDGHEVGVRSTLAEDARGGGVATDGRLLLVVWGETVEGRAAVRGALVERAGETLDVVARLSFGDPDEAAEAPIVAGGASGFVVVWAEWEGPNGGTPVIRLAAVDSESRTVIPLPAGPPVGTLDRPSTGVVRPSHQVVVRGEEALLTWNEGNAVMATRLDVHTGVALDRPPRVLGTKRTDRSAPRAVATASGYLVAWPGAFRGFEYDDALPHPSDAIAGVFLEADGTLPDPRGFTLASGGNSRDHMALVPGPTYTLLAYSERDWRERYLARGNGNEHLRFRLLCTECCDIGGVIVLAGGSHPTDPCLACVPAESRGDWSWDLARGCDDQDACTVEDGCSGWVCSGRPRDCDDANPCTEDDCDSEAGCRHAAIVAPCDDGDPCTTDDTCVVGTCVGAALPCDDANPCTEDRCVEGACTTSPTPAGAPCGPGSACADGVCTLLPPHDDVRSDPGDTDDPDGRGAGDGDGQGTDGGGATDQPLPPEAREDSPAETSAPLDVPRPPETRGDDDTPGGSEGHGGGCAVGSATRGRSLSALLLGLLAVGIAWRRRPGAHGRRPRSPRRLAVLLLLVPLPAESAGPAIGCPEGACVPPLGLPPGIVASCPRSGAEPLCRYRVGNQSELLVSLQRVYRGVGLFRRRADRLSAEGVSVGCTYPTASVPPGEAAYRAAPWPDIGFTAPASSPYEYGFTPEASGAFVVTATAQPVPTLVACRSTFQVTGYPRADDPCEVDLPVQIEHRLTPECPPEVGPELGVLPLAPAQRTGFAVPSHQAPGTPNEPEVQAFLEVITQGAAAFFRAQPAGACRFPDGQAITPVERTCCGKLGGPGADDDGACDLTDAYFDNHRWRDVGLLASVHSFVYGFFEDRSAGDRRLVVEAYGDVDCDGLQSTFRRFVRAVREDGACDAEVVPGSFTTFETE